MGIKKISASNAKNTVGTTNWKAVKSMTDEDIIKASQTDLISKELKVVELMKFKRENLNKSQ